MARGFKSTGERKKYVKAKNTKLSADRVIHLDYANRRKKPFQEVGERKGRRGETIAQADRTRLFKVKKAKAALAKEPQYVQDAVHDIQNEVKLDLQYLPWYGGDELSISHPVNGVDESEDEGDVLRAIRDEIGILAGTQRATVRSDDRSYETRLLQHDKHWKSSADLYARCLLQWRNGVRVDLPNETGTNTPPEALWENDFSASKLSKFSIDTLGMDGYTKQKTFWSISPLLNFSLLRQGYIGTSPVKPKLAIPLQTLDDYVLFRRQCPSLSIERLTKALCARAQVQYIPYLRQQLSNAVDFFMDMERRIDSVVDDLMQRNTLRSRLLSACPACHHKTENEQELHYSMILAMDGNESQRRNASNSTDPRRFESNFYLSEEFVNQYAEEAKSKAKHREVPTEGKPGKECTRNWTAAKPDGEKGMFTTYDETGIFILTCRHGSVLLIVDMIRSGEKSKYPLAIVSKVLEVYGKNVFIAYDIGCSFTATLRNSTLGEQAQNKGLRLGTPSWHGWSHNRQCQLDFHPLFMEGLGLEDGEGCERVFSRTNGCARVTRYSSKYHRKLVIDMTVNQWNTEKHANLGLFIFNNYKQAQDILRQNETSLSRLESAGVCHRSQFPGFVEKERAYLKSLEMEPPKETMEVQYIELLQKLQETERVVSEAKARLDACPVHWKDHRSKLRRIWRSALEMNLHREQHAKQFEEAERITERWKEGDNEWNKALQHLRMRRYRRALDELSRLIVQRLFELEKMGVGGTAYKLRKSLAKALKRRSAALSTALERFNEEAKKLKRSTLQFSDLLSYSFIADLALLCDSREDIRDADWTKPAVRQAVVGWLRMERAKEEIKRLELEAIRLKAWIAESKSKRSALIHDMALSDPHLAMELKRKDTAQQVYDKENLRYLARMTRLTTLFPDTDVTLFSADQMEIDIDKLESDDDGVDEMAAEEVEDLERITDFLRLEPDLAAVQIE